MGAPALDASEACYPKMLIVDDDAAIRMLLREPFEDAGFVVEEARSGTEAINLLSRFWPDVVLLDVVMPELDGFETCRRMHRRRGFEDLPILMMTGLDDVESINRAYDAGAADVFSKPLNWVRVIHSVRRSMDLVRMTRKLRNADACQRAITELLEILYCRVRRDGTLREFRAGIEMGRPADQLHWQGKRIEQVLLPKHPSRLLDRIAQCPKPGEIQTFVESLAFDGAPRDYQIKAVSIGPDEFTVIVLKSDSGAIDAAGGRDEFFRHVVEGLPDPVLVMDSGGRIEYQNPAATKQLATNKHRPGKRNGLDFVHPRDAALVFNGIVDSCGPDARGSHCEFRARNRGGDWSIWDSRIVSLPQETFSGFLLIGHDVTELKRTQSELVCQRSQAEATARAKAELLGVVAHELRSPLNNILGHADLLLQDMSDGLTQSHRMSLQRIRRNARLIRNLVFSVLDMARLELGILALACKEVCLRELLEEVRDEIELQAGAAALDIEWRIGGDLPVLNTDPMKLKIVMRNLLANALKFAPAGTISVDARSTGAGVELSVTDAGTGIAYEQQPFVFEPFHDGTGSPETTGLGLYIVKRFVDLLGGDIRLDSHPGEGTRVYLSLASISRD